ncbi:hypothetical protein HBI56_048290 [Parastagonospora nodorum]|nr:hypothetical protein HBH52_114250 [Parastagonospora nodorum]KAH5519846.1 hypothetical protein HBI52_084260 [Parastagonospora nodorum]KAH6468973.1 hypothetical protein HBI59_048160 [Parastagonospora nodorum]KAH6537206.1 hypothetical protein HBI56_048290 [Parastagonospora nodorum]
MEYFKWDTCSSDDNSDGSMHRTRLSTPVGWDNSNGNGAKGRGKSRAKVGPTEKKLVKEVNKLFEGKHSRRHMQTRRMFNDLPPIAQPRDGGAPSAS